MPSLLLLYYIPPNYHHDYFLYLVDVDNTIAMVLVVQDDDDGDEHMIYYLSWNIFDTETRYAHVKKLDLGVVQGFPYYILLQKTTAISNCNPMTYILTRQLLGGKYSKWIVILQEFDLEFVKAKWKKSLIFAELICDLPSSITFMTSDELILDKTLLLISTDDPWYRDIITYLQMQNFQSELSDSKHWHIRH